MQRLSVLLVGVALQACSGAGDTGEPKTDGGNNAADANSADPFAEVTLELEASFPDNSANAPGMTLLVFNSDDERVYEYSVGDASPEKRMPIASASKLVAGLSLLRVVEAGDLALSETTAAVLGWSGANGAITLDELGAFVSGLRSTFLCTANPNTTLQACVRTIENATPSAPPQQQFAYGNSHLHVAARMAEVATEMPWLELTRDRLFAPLGLTEPALSYASTDNPLVAGGLAATPDEYAPILALLFHRGARAGTQLISEALMDRFTANSYPEVTIATSPYANEGYDYRYGFASWLECPASSATCSTVSSAGSFGFLPWIDRESGYYAILAMEGERRVGSVFAVELQHRLKPMIASALAELAN